MRKLVLILWLCVVIILCVCTTGFAALVGTVFTYQGRLMDQGSPANGDYDFEFHIYDVEILGSSLGMNVLEEVAVEDGYFTVELDFGGSVFAGDARWLEIGIRPGELADPNEYTTLSSRQELTPAPYAMYALNGSGSGGFWEAKGNDIYNTNIGSVGIGTMDPSAKLDVEVTSSGPAAAIGHISNSATGDFAIAMGFGTEAIGSSSTAMGNQTNAIAGSSTAMGYGSTASGDYSTAMGYLTTANGHYSTAMGTSTLASGGYSTAIGISTTANGNLSTAMGNGTTASGSRSTAMGTDITVQGDCSFGIGLKDDTFYNITQDNIMAIMGGQVGIGTTSPEAMLHINIPGIETTLLKLSGGAPSEDRLVVKEDGEVDINGDLRVTGAYKGNLGPNNGAPFPKPAYDSGWMIITQSEHKVLTHSIGGNVDNYVVDLQFKDDLTWGINNVKMGGDEARHLASACDAAGGSCSSGYHASVDPYEGACWTNLTTSSITLVRQKDDVYADQIRVRIWYYND